MRKLLIAETSEEFSAALTAVLSAHYQITQCANGEETVFLLNTVQPDVLIINLALPGADGLYVLRNAAFKPPVILVLTTIATNYILQAAKEAGAGYVVMLPCTVQCVVNHLNDMVRLASAPVSRIDPQAVTEIHLHRLGLQPHRVGFAQLRAGIPMFAQDEGQLMKKELYPAIAALYGNSNPEQVERTIREAIKEAWACRDEAIWKEYFPNWEKAPTNKAFIAVLAQKLRQEEQK